MAGRRQGPALPVLAAWLVLVLAAALCLAFGSWLLDRAPVTIAIAADGRNLTVTVDGTAQETQIPAVVTGVRFPSPPAEQREYQIDGSDSTNNFTFDPAYFAREATTPYYRVQAWLRDAGSYSRWQQLEIRDGAGRLVIRDSRPANDRILTLPQPFRLKVILHRLETPRRVELIERTGGAVRVVIDRNDRYVRITALDAGGAEHDLATRYFPLTWQPAFVEVADLLLRSAALAFALAAALTVSALALPAVRLCLTPVAARAAGAAATAFVVIATAYIATTWFDRAPHILDAVSYTFQAKIFASGRLAAPVPPLSAAFPTPFFVADRGKWFSQYPPGTPALLAVGVRLGLPWLVEPALAALATLLTFAAARRQFGLPTAVCAALLFTTSPFMLLQAGTYLSHVPAMACAAIALYATTRYLEQPQQRWVVLGAVGLGCAFLCREIVAILYGLPLCIFVLWPSRRRSSRPPLGDILLAGSCLACFLLVYLLYNKLQTGQPFLLPRNVFNPADQFGFGKGIGFYGQHTLGAGFVNTDELLTSLTIVLFGWPYGVALALLLAPLVLRRPQPWEVVHAGVVGLFVVAYAGYFYHGIAFGPRYYFEALPSMVILAARGLSALAYRASVVLAGWGRRQAWERGQTAAVALLVLLLACNLIYFLPRQQTLYQGYSGMPGLGGPPLGRFITHSPAGRMSALTNALVTTDNWWYYTVYLAVLNCPSLRCGTVFAYAPDASTLRAVRGAFPGRTWYRIDDQGGTLEAVPG